MALKDCTFFVDVNGKQVEMDYDQFRAYLLDGTNLSVLAPTLATKKGAKVGFERAEATPSKAKGVGLEAQQSPKRLEYLDYLRGTPDKIKFDASAFAAQTPPERANRSRADNFIERLYMLIRPFRDEDTRKYTTINDSIGRHGLQRLMELADGFGIAVRDQSRLDADGLITSYRLYYYSKAWEYKDPLEHWRARDIIVDGYGNVYIGESWAHQLPPDIPGYVRTDTEYKASLTGEQTAPVTAEAEAPTTKGEAKAPKGQAPAAKKETETQKGEVLPPNAPRPVTVESLRATMGLTKAEAEAVMAVYKAMGLPLPMFRVAKGLFAKPELQDMYEAELKKSGTLARGYIEFYGEDDAKLDGVWAIIRGFNAANVTTPIHEGAHFYRRFMLNTENGFTAEEIKTVEDWAGAKNGEWSSNAEEKFARGFERYLRSGASPLPALAKVFEKMAKWFQNIYKTVSGSAIDIDITPEVKRVFDRIFELQAEKVKATGGERILEQRVEAGKDGDEGIGPVWRSNTLEALGSWKQNKGTPAQLMAHLSKTKGASEEAKWIGLNEFLEGKATVTRAEVEDFVAKNPYIVQINVVGEEDAQYSEYAVQGGTDYREIVLTSPQVQFTSGHFQEVPNYLAHIRISIFRDIYGRKVLLVDEVQSDLHQKGRKKGYATPEMRRKLASLTAQQAALSQRERDQRGEVDKALFDLAQKLIGHTGTQRISWYNLANELFNFAAQKAVILPRPPLRRQGWIPAVTAEQIRAFAPSRTPEYVGNVQALAQRAGLRDEFNAVIKQVHAYYATRQEFDRVQAGIEGNDVPPDAPFKGSTEWAVMAFKRAIRLAVEEGADVIAWTPGEIQEQRYGGEAGQLAKFYNEVLPPALAKFVRPWGGKITTVELDRDTSGEDDAEEESQWESLSWQEMEDIMNGVTEEGIPADQEFPAIVITPQMKSEAKKGFVLFQAEPIQPEDYSEKARIVAEKRARAMEAAKAKAAGTQTETAKPQTSRPAPSQPRFRAKSPREMADMLEDARQSIRDAAAKPLKSEAEKAHMRIDREVRRFLRDFASKEFKGYLSDEMELPDGTKISREKELLDALEDLRKASEDLSRNPQNNSGAEKARREALRRINAAVFTPLTIKQMGDRLNAIKQSIKNIAAEPPKSEAEKAHARIDREVRKFLRDFAQKQFKGYLPNEMELPDGTKVSREKELLDALEDLRKASEDLSRNPQNNSGAEKARREALRRINAALSTPLTAKELGDRLNAIKQAVRDAAAEPPKSEAERARMRADREVRQFLREFAEKQFKGYLSDEMELPDGTKVNREKELLDALEDLKKAFKMLSESTRYNPDAEKARREALRRVNAALFTPPTAKAKQGHTLRNILTGHAWGKWSPRSPLSYAQYKGSYERIAGELGARVSLEFQDVRTRFARGQYRNFQAAMEDLKRRMRPLKAELRQEGFQGLPDVIDAHIERIEQSARQNSTMSWANAKKAFNDGQVVEYTSAIMKAFVFNTKLRFNPKSIGLNYLQPMFTLYPYFSAKEMVELYRQALDPDVQKRIRDVAIAESGGRFSQEMREGEESRIPNPFTKSSELVRIMGHLAGERMAERNKIAEAVRPTYIRDWAEKAEFDNSSWNIGPIFSGPILSVLLQFTPYVVKNLERFATDIRRQPGDKGFITARQAKVLAVQLGVSGPASLLTLIPGAKWLIGPVMLGLLAQSLGELADDDELGETLAEGLYYGVPAAFGTDLSSSLGFINEPQGRDTTEQILSLVGGPFFSTVANSAKQSRELIKIASKPLKAGEGKDREEEISRRAWKLASTFTPYARMAKTGTEMARGERPSIFLDKETPLSNYEIALRLLGGSPIRQTAYFEMKEAMDWQKELIGKQPDVPGITREKGETDATYREKVRRVTKWQATYGKELEAHPRFKALDAQTQKKAADIMNGNISEMAGRKRPDLSRLRPAYVIRRAKESIKDAPRRAKGQMFTPAPEED